MSTVMMNYSNLQQPEKNHGTTEIVDTNTKTTQVHPNLHPRI